MIIYEYIYIYIFFCGLNVNVYMYVCLYRVAATLTLLRVWHQIIWCCYPKQQICQRGCRFVHPLLSYFDATIPINIFATGGAG